MAEDWSLHSEKSETEVLIMAWSNVIVDFNGSYIYLFDRSSEFVESFESNEINFLDS